MSDTPLTAEQILDAARDVLRRYGPAKTTVVDVARELGVSHGSVYRHFPSKAALRDAVAEQWLGSISERLAEIADDDTGALERLHTWLRTLIATKHDRARDDPELFRTYAQLAGESRQVITAHVAELTGQLARIIADGVARGELAVEQPTAAARAVFDATGRFHNPAHAAEWSDPGIDAAFEGVWSLIRRALACPAPPARRPPKRSR